MRRARENAFTLVEIMLVMSIIGLVTAIAMPNFVRSRIVAQENTCITNLRQIESAKQLWALATNGSYTATPEWEDLTPEYIKRTPECPANGTYTIGSVSEPPDCDVEGHVLPGDYIGGISMPFFLVDMAPKVDSLLQLKYGITLEELLSLPSEVLETMPEPSQPITTVIEILMWFEDLEPWLEANGLI